MDDIEPAEAPASEARNPGCLGYVIGCGSLVLGAAFLLSIPVMGLLILEESSREVGLRKVLLVEGLYALPGLFFGIALVSYGWTLIRRTRAKDGETVDVFAGPLGRVNAVCGIIFSGGGILMILALALISFLDESVSALVALGYAAFFIPLLSWVGKISWAGLRS